MFRHLQVAYLTKEIPTSADYIHMVISVWPMSPLLFKTRFIVAMNSLAHTVLLIIL